MILNLDKKFKPLGNKNEVEFHSFTFSGGEPHINIINDLRAINEVFITHRVRSFNDIGLLLMAVDALRNMGIRDIDLVLPYFPGARQDRIMNDGEALSVKVYADLFNNLGLRKLTIYDAHSEVTPAVLANCQVINNHRFIEKILQGLNKNTLLISPDGGALKKIYKVAAYLQDYTVVECSKSRDVRTGKLSGFKVYTDDLQGQDCLIVDDICDGGGTFLGLAKELIAKNAGKLYLAVSHGIFSKGIDELETVFEQIFTTDSFKDTDHELVKQIKLNELL